MAHRELVTFQKLKYFLRTLSLQRVHENEGFPYLEILFPFAPMFSPLKGLAIMEDKKLCFEQHLYYSCFDCSHPFHSSWQLNYRRPYVVVVCLFGGWVCVLRNATFWINISPRSLHS